MIVEKRWIRKRQMRLTKWVRTLECLSSLNTPHLYHGRPWCNPGYANNNASELRFATFRLVSRIYETCCAETKYNIKTCSKAYRVHVYVLNVQRGTETQDNNQQCRPTAVQLYMYKVVHKRASFVTIGVVAGGEEEEEEDLFAKWITCKHN